MFQELIRPRAQLLLSTAGLGDITSLVVLHFQGRLCTETQQPSAPFPGILLTNRGKLHNKHWVISANVVKWPQHGKGFGFFSNYHDGL